MNINKIDFYCGAFLSYLITNKVEPTLFDATDKSKVIRFSLRSQDYNIYLKYSTSLRESSHHGMTFRSWNVPFTKQEKQFINHQFYDKQRENLVVIVCTDRQLRNTCFAVLTYRQALACLGDDHLNKNPYIAAKHPKGSEYLYCYGTSLSDTDAIKTYFNTDKYFQFNEKVAADK